MRRAARPHPRPPPSWRRVPDVGQDQRDDEERGGDARRRARPPVPRRTSRRCPGGRMAPARRLASAIAAAPRSLGAGVSGTGARAVRAARARGNLVAAPLAGAEVALDGGALAFGERAVGVLREQRVGWLMVGPRTLGPAPPVPGS